MDHASIEDAYEPFVAALRRGGFKAPADGWPAELVAAHVVRNNDLVSEVAEQLVIGVRPSYDNRSAVDESELQALADEAGGLEGLATAVEASARRLVLAFSALDEASREHLVACLIVDSGRIVRDEPMPVRSLVEGNASYHLDMHLKQLNALSR